MKALIFFAVVLTLNSVSSTITYQLYTIQNKGMGQPLIYKNANSVYSSNFNSAKKNKMLIHGYGQNGRSAFNKDIKNSFLNQKDHDYNIIVVDWSTAFGSSYTSAVANVRNVGMSVAKFIDWMSLHKGDVQLIGFDLGAHVAGIAGKHTTKGRVDKITGLDPNRNGFNVNQSVNRLASGDARFVEVYHSNGGKLGIMAHLVDSDIYINDGKSQPNCETDSCSHYFSVEVFVNQVLGKKYSRKTCETLQELDGRGCGHTFAEWWGEETGLKQLITVEDEDD